MAISSALYTTVRNVSGSEMHFSFLPPHGKTLAAGEDYDIPGDFLTALLAGGSRANRIRFNAFIRALGEGGDPTLFIVSSPGLLLHDGTLDDTRQVTLDNGVLTTRQPDWEESASSSISV